MYTKGIQRSSAFLRAGFLEILMNALQLLALATALSTSLLVPYGIVQAASPSFTTLYSFTGQNGDGSGPQGSLAIGKGGSLYGATVGGGTVTDACASTGGYCGTVFELTPPTTGVEGWVETVLYKFTGQNGDGWRPLGGVVIGSGGVIYGTTGAGGAGVGCCGTFFRLTPPATPNGLWTESVLHSFTGQDGDGSGPQGSLAIGKDGMLFGTTAFGGAAGFGTVFRMTPPATPGGAWTETVLFSFTASNGYPITGLVISADGVLYGTTSSGSGAVFELRPPSILGGTWTETDLFNFNQIDGESPNGVALGADGVLFGTTYLGGLSDCAGGGACGTVFELAPPAAVGGAWTQTVLCNLGGVGPCLYGIWPMTGVAIAKNGALYGTTAIGPGTLFALTPSAVPDGAWTQTVLHSWGAVGPIGGGLIIGDNGALYGTSLNSGNNNDGMIFEWKP